MKKEGMQRDDLTRYLDTLLGAAEYRDYCPNGLQVEGRAEVRRVVCGVSACQALLDVAVAREADAVLVHHGWFWRGEDGRVAGIRKARLKTLLENDISLIAYHLPLDGHAEFGNNAQLAQRLDWTVEGRFGEQDVGWYGRLNESRTLGEVAHRVSAELGREALVIGAQAQQVSRIAWCSGGAQSLFEAALSLGVQAFLSGEISEQHVHLARESGVAYLAVGHHASERYGIQALAAHLAGKFGLDCTFIDIDNPV